MDYFFYNQLSTYRKGIFSLFDDLYIKTRKDDKRDLSNEMTKIEVVFATKNKMKMLLSNEDQEASMASMQYPFISIIPRSISYNDTKTRFVQHHINIKESENAGKIIAVPTPIIQNYDVFIITQSYGDLDQIIEQLLPNLMPGINLIFNFDLYPKPISSKVLVTNADYDTEFSWDSDNERKISFLISLSQEIYLFKALKHKEFITEFNFKLEETV